MGDRIAVIANLFFAVLGIIAIVVTAVTDNLGGFFPGSLSNDDKVIIALLIGVLTVQGSYFIQAYDLGRKVNKFSGFDDVLKAHDLLKSSGPEKESIEALLQRLQDARGGKYGNRTIINQQRQHILRGAIQEMDMLSRGEFKTYFWKCSVLKEAVKDMDKELIGLSPLPTTDDRWWNCASGEEFLELNRKLVKKGKKITRIFVHEEDLTQDQINHRIAELTTQHKGAATAGYLVSKRVLRTQGWSRVGDEAMAVVDENFAFWAETNRPLEHYDRNYYSFDKQEVDKKREILIAIEYIAKNSGTSLNLAVGSGSLELGTQGTQGRQLADEGLQTGSENKGSGSPVGDVSHGTAQRTEQSS